jgi:hypothetical protein
VALLSSLAQARAGCGVTIVTATASVARARVRPRASCSIIKSLGIAPMHLSPPCSPESE